VAFLLVAFSDMITIDMINLGLSLIDITQTNDKSMVDSKSRNQQRNFESLIQVMKLRCEPVLLGPPIQITADLSGFRFGSEYTGIHTVWAFNFTTNPEGVFSDGISPFGLLENDFVKVPVILGLDETVPMNLSTFKVVGPQRNIYFQNLVNTL
jgi:hypothetical protein